MLKPFDDFLIFLNFIFLMNCDRLCYRSDGFLFGMFRGVWRLAHRWTPYTIDGSLELRATGA